VQVGMTVNQRSSPVQVRITVNQQVTSFTCAGGNDCQSTSFTCAGASLVASRPRDEDQTEDDISRSG